MKLSVEKATKNLAGLRKDRREHLEIRDKKISEAEEKGFAQEHIDRLQAERDNLKNLYDAAIERAKAAFEQAKSDASEEAAQAEERRNAVMAQKKANAKRLWEQAGGDPDAFEDAWPSLYTTIVTEDTLSAMRTEQETNPTVKL